MHLSLRYNLDPTPRLGLRIRLGHCPLCSITVGLREISRREREQRPSVAVSHAPTVRPRGPAVFKCGWPRAASHTAPAARRQALSVGRVLLFVNLIVVLYLAVGPINGGLPFPALLVFVTLNVLLNIGNPARVSFDSCTLARAIYDATLLFVVFCNNFGAGVSHTGPITTPTILLDALNIIVATNVANMFTRFILNFS